MCFQGTGNVDIDAVSRETRPANAFIGAYVFSISWCESCLSFIFVAKLVRRPRIVQTDDISFGKGKSKLEVMEDGNATSAGRERENGRSVCVSHPSFHSVHCFHDAIPRTRLCKFSSFQEAELAW